MVKLANVILLGNVVSEVQALNILAPFVTFANVMLFGIFVILLPMNIAKPFVTFANVMLLGIFVILLPPNI